MKITSNESPYTDQQMREVIADRLDNEGSDLWDNVRIPFFMRM